MRDFLRFGLTAIVLAFVLSALTACDDKEILKRMEARSKSLKTLKADVTMEKYNAQLKESDVYKGKMFYIPPTQRSDMALRVDWLKPKNESLTVINRLYAVYTPGLKLAYKGTIDRPEISGLVNDALAFMNVSQEKLKADYNIKFFGREIMGGGAKAFRLEFTPKVKKQFKTVDVWADKEGTPVSIKVTMDNNDSTTISFSNVEKNTSLNANVFTLKLPPGVKIIRN